MSDSLTAAQPDEYQQSPAPPEGKASFAGAIKKDVLSRYIDILTAVTEEAMIEVTSAGLRAAAFGPSKVNGVDARAGPSAFEAFDVIEEGYIALDLPLVDDLLSTVESEIVDIAVGTSRELSISTDTLGYSGASLVLASVDEIQAREKFTAPFDDPLLAEIGILVEDLKAAVGSAAFVDDHLTLSYDTSAGSLQVSATGDNSNIERVYGRDRLIAPDHRGDASAIEATYTVEEIERQLAPVPSDTEMMMQYSKEKPIGWEYDTGEGISVQGLVAPRL